MLLSSIIKYNAVSEGQIVSIGQILSTELEQEVHDEALLVEEIQKTQGIREEKERILETARQEAAIILEAANQKLRDAAVMVESMKQTFSEEQEAKEQLNAEMIQSIEMQKQDMLKEYEIMRQQIQEEAHEQKATMMKVLETNLKELVTYLVETIVGECTFSPEWILASLKKIIYKEQLTFPLTISVSEDYTEEQMSVLKEKLSHFGEEIEIVRSIGQNKNVLEVQTSVGSIVYNTAEAMDHMVRQLHTLNILESV